MPVFDGEILDFANFRKSFEDLVLNLDVPATNKLNALRKVVGPTLQPWLRAISSEVSIETIWDSLRQRYENPYILAMATLDKRASICGFKRLIRVSLKDHVPPLLTFTTILCRVEAILNSRPLTALTTDVQDFEVITPAHFLVQRPLNSIAVEPEQMPNTFAAKWRLVNQVTKSFWRRWSREYVTTLQQSTKWNTHSRKPILGEIVILVEDGVTPCQWKLARIVALTPGPDIVVRVADIVTADGAHYTRPVVRLCPLTELS